MPTDRSGLSANRKGCVAPVKDGDAAYKSLGPADGKSGSGGVTRTLVDAVFAL